MAAKYHEYVIRLTAPKVYKEGSKMNETPAHIHVDITQNFIVVMRRNGDILKIKHSSLTDGIKGKETPLEFTHVKLPVKEFYKDKSNVDEIGLKWMYVNDLVQFKLKTCQIHYDLEKDIEVTSLNNY